VGGGAAGRLVVGSAAEVEVQLKKTGTFLFPALMLPLAIYTAAA